ncbi:LamB/YcsF family protein, partial [Streptomyces sp. NPDC001215]
MIDLNADLGEGFGRWRLTDDERLLSVVTSANVACGFHAGDAATMRRVCRLAAERGVRIGAQVSYRDLAGFGRRAMDVPPAELAAEVAYQIGALEVFARAAGSNRGGRGVNRWEGQATGRREGHVADCRFLPGRP